MKAAFADGGVNVGGNGGGRVGSESVATSDRCLSYYYSTRCSCNSFYDWVNRGEPNISLTLSDE